MSEIETLAIAMDDVELAGGSIPCKDDPEAFILDSVGQKGPFPKRLVAQLRAACKGCPVFEQCEAYADAEGNRLFGVVAGRLITTVGSNAHKRRITNPEGDSA